MEQFEEVTLIGSGAYGKVYRAKRRHDGRCVALKKVKTSRSHGVHSTTIREIGILKQIKHQNVVELLDVISTQKCMIMVFEHLEYDLKRYIALHLTEIDGRFIKSVMFQLIEGVRCLHDNRVLHRDLKSQNVLVDGDGRVVKIADFGLARMFSLPSRPYTHEVVTLWYRAPELLLGMKIYSFAVDMWSLGCIFTELVLGEPLFRGQSEIDQLMKIFKVLGTPTEQIWPGVENLPFYISRCPQWDPQPLGEATQMTDPLALDLLEKMLCYDPSKRITAAEALSHGYFADVATKETERVLQPTSIANRIQNFRQQTSLKALSRLGWK